MPTGFGGGGLASVSTNTTLSGTGTGASPLSVNGWPLIAWATAPIDTTIALGGANFVYISGFFLPLAVTFSNLVFNVITPDAANNYDVGIYTKAGALIANIGAQHLTPAGIKSIATLQGAQTLLPGLYLSSWTGNANTATIAGGGTTWTWRNNTNVATSAGGVLPASITAQTVSYGTQLLGLALS